MIQTGGFMVMMLVMAIASSPALAGDVNAGKGVFTRCAACHRVDKGGADGLGPNLFGVVGRKAGSRPNFSYSPALKNAGFVWTPQKLDAWIAHPAQVVPGNRMAFAGILNAQDRADLIAYLATLK
ncbi:MAG: cytochrome c family protein [Alphaproteobacteria bacterium]|nr:cytochrome c family protein [Alphaproteobacteria bacterium]